MIGTRLVGVVVTVLVVLALAVGGVAAGVSAGGHSTQDGVDSEESAPGGSVSGPTFDGPGIAQGSSEVGLELRPTNQTVAPGGNATYDIVITDPENGISAYSFNVSVADLGVAEIDGFALDRTGFFDNSFITGDNRTLALDVGLGENGYAPAPEVTVATVNVTAAGSPDDSTDIGFEYDPNQSVLDSNSALYTVTSDQSASLRIDAPPEFLVSNLTPADATVIEGETLNISANVTNVGGSATQTVSLDVDGFGQNRTVTLGNGQSRTVTFEAVDTGALGAGGYQHTVSSANESVSGNLTVLAAANFAVSITGTSTPVEGERLNVTAEVTNTGDIEDTQTVTLDTGALGIDSTSVTLGGDVSTNVTLSVGTGSGDAGEYTVTVSSADDSGTANVTVLAAANFAVSITGTTTPVAGEQVNVTAEVTNTGDVAESQTIALEVGALGSDTTTVTLGGGTSTNVTLSVGTSSGDAGEYTATVSSPDETASASVTVLAPASFAVSITETSTPVEGERLNVTAEIQNTGDVADSQTIALDAVSLGSDSTNVMLDGGASTNVTLSVTTSNGDAGAYTATVSSADDSGTANVTVLSAANFAVSIAETTTPVEGEQLNVTAEIQNTGEVADSQTISLAAGALGGDSTSVTLDGGASTKLTLSVGTSSGDAGAYVATVSSADETATANVTVLVPATFAVELTGTGGSVVAGESLTVSYEVTNTGDVRATQTVEFAVNGSAETTETNVTLGGGETFTGQFAYETTGDDVPGVTVSVSSADDTATETVTVLSPGAFVVELTSIDDSVVAGENLTVAYEVTNSGDTEATQTVEIAVAGTVEDTQSVTLGGDETFAGEFSYETGEGDVPELNVSVSSVDDTVTATVPVLEPAAFAVTLTDVAGPVVAGESLTVGYEVTNTGGVEATQTVEFAVNGSAETTETNVTLGSGETFTGQFAYETTGDDVPGVTVSVSSADDTATETVAVLEPALFDVALTDIDSEVTAGETVTVEYEVTNTGDIEATQTVEFAVDGSAEATETNVTLGGGETSTGQFAYETVEEDVPAVNISVASTDDTATETVAVLAPVDPTPALSNLTIAGDGNETLVLDGADENVTVDVTNLGTTSTAFNVTLTFEGPETVELTETVTVGGGETTALTFENATDAVDAGAYNVTLSAADAELMGALTVSVTVDDGQPATDTTGDARLNDIDGNRAFGIFDVQEFFVNFQTPTVQNNPAAFNFDGSGDGEVTIFDVQALFVELVLQDT